MEVNSCIVYGNTTDDLDGCTATDSWLTIDGDPKFENAGEDNYHISRDSDCIGAGDPDLIVVEGEVDIDGNDRVMGWCTSRVDIGADEIFYSDCWDSATQCYADASGPLGVPDGLVNNFDWDNFRDGYGKCYADADNTEYMTNVCADNTRDGCIDNFDWDNFRDYYGQTIPTDCDICGGESAASGGGGSVLSSGSAMSSEEAVEWEIEGLAEMLEWLNELWVEDAAFREVNDETSWEAFVELIEGAILELEDSL